MNVKMADSPLLFKASKGLSEIDRSLSVAIKAAAVAASDKDLPIEAIPPFREAARAIEFAIKKIAAASDIVTKASKRKGAISAD